MKSTGEKTSAKKESFIPKNRNNLAERIFVLVVALWVVSFSAIALFSSWVVEQTLVQASAILADTRWMTHLVASLIMLLPCVLGAFFVRNARLKGILTLWSIGGVFAILTTPAKFLFISAQNETAFLQIWAALLLMLIWRLVKKGKPGVVSSPVFKIQVPGLVIFLACLICLPWVLWGAFGSLLDTVLVILLAAILALVMIEIMGSFARVDTSSADGQVQRMAVFHDGLVYFVFLIIISAALGVNGSQEMLVLTLPLTGWLISLAFHLGEASPRGGKNTGALILALAVALPLAFFDMDELLMFFPGEGEVTDWAIKAALTTLVLLFVLVFAAIVWLPRLKKLVLPKSINFILSFLGVCGLLLSYFFVGQPGFFGDHVFAILEPQADLSEISENNDAQERRALVYQELIRVAQTTQIDLRTRLTQMNLPFTPYYLLNALEVEGGKLVEWWLQRQPNVDRVLESPQLRPLPQSASLASQQSAIIPADALWNLKLIGVDRVRQELNITGSDILIGQTDSGVDGRHPELGDAYRGVLGGDDYNWLDPWYQSASPIDPGGHGTLTLGVILGENIGVAPDAQWIACTNLARNLGNPAYYLDCMQFMLAPFPQSGDPFTDGDPARGAMIVNNSWGCPEVEGCDAQVFGSAVQALTKAGVFMSVSAGNSGIFGCSTISDPPAIYEEVFTAGSIDKNGNLSSFSSLGPVSVDGTFSPKPDLLAPGDEILSSYPGGGYSFVSGTSFAAPHVSGVVALMWSANPALIGDVDATSEILRNATKPYNGRAPFCGDVQDAVGYGVLDAYQAVLAAMNWPATLPSK